MGWRVDRPSHPPQPDDELDEWSDADWKAYWEDAMEVSLTTAQWRRLNQRMALEFWVDRGWSRAHKFGAIVIAVIVTASEAVQGVAAVVDLVSH